SLPVSKVPEPKAVAIGDLADNQLPGNQLAATRPEEVQSSPVPLEVVQEAGRKPAEDKPAAKEVDKKIAEDKKATEDKSAAKEPAQKTTKEDVPPSPPQGSLF